MIGAGAAYAGIVVPRLSPLGPALVGFAYLGLGLWIVSDLSSFVSTMPGDLLGLDNAGFGPGLYLIPLSIPLLATLVSPNRWMGRPRPAMVGAPPAQPPGARLRRPRRRRNSSSTRRTVASPPATAVPRRSARRTAGRRRTTAGRRRTGRRPAARSGTPIRASTAASRDTRRTSCAPTSPAASNRPHGDGYRLSSWRAITMRWTWFVPS